MCETVPVLVQKMVFCATSSLQDGCLSFLKSTLPCWCYLPECGLFSGLRAWPRPDDRFIHSTRSQRRLALGTMCLPFLPAISFTRGSWLVVLVESELAFFLPRGSLKSKLKACDLARSVLRQQQRQWQREKTKQIQRQIRHVEDQVA